MGFPSWMNPRSGAGVSRVGLRLCGGPLLVWLLLTHQLQKTLGAIPDNATACPPEGTIAEGKLPSGKMCMCEDPLKKWNGFACCVPNSHWNGTACECDIYHNLEHGLCCHEDIFKGWGADRCGCFNGSKWNGNSCLPEGVVCMPNALWNGTHCYCKPAHWESNTPADVVVNGACCSENSYFDWKGFQGDGLCMCNPGTWWNQTHCLPVLPNVLPHGLSPKIKIALALGLGAGGALTLAVSVCIGVLFHKRRKAADGMSGSGKPAPQYPFVTATRPDTDTTTVAATETLNPVRASWKCEPLQGSLNGLPASSRSAATTISTARDLLSESHGLFGADFDGYGPIPDILGDGAASTLCHSGKTDSAHTMHSRPYASASLKGHEEADELWTRGVDPADVEILRNEHGQPTVLGRGGYAVVYLGRWQATLVAVKVMLSSDSEAAQREVRAEADILRGLRHPNIVLLMAISIAPTQQMMVILEYCAGGNLLKALRKDFKSATRHLGWYSTDRKQPGKGFVVALDIARGLAYLHHRQLIHFDIKPANILLDATWTHAKVSDVGLSKCVHGSVVTQTMRGTPTYMAPELMSFKHATTFAVDIYSFGVVLHHIITGEEPDRRNVLRVPRVPEECSCNVACLYESCMQEDPRLRPSAADVVATLEKEFCFGRAQSAPGPEIELDLSLNPNPRAVVSFNPQRHTENEKHEGLATTYVQ